MFTTLYSIPPPLDVVVAHQIKQPKVTRPEPPWFSKDMGVLLAHCEAMGLRVGTWLVNPNKDEEGYYSRVDSIILLSPELSVKNKPVCVSTLLHELGHHYDYEFRGLQSDSCQLHEVLLCEYMAGIFGYYLHKALGLKMPVRFYTKSNNDNLREYVSEIRTVLGDTEYTHVANAVHQLVVSNLHRMKGEYPGVFPLSESYYISR